MNIRIAPNLFKQLIQYFSIKKSNEKAMNIPGAARSLWKPPEGRGPGQGERRLRLMPRALGSIYIIDLSAHLRTLPTRIQNEGHELGDAPSSPACKFSMIAFTFFSSFISFLSFTCVHYGTMHSMRICAGPRRIGFSILFTCLSILF